MIYVGLDCHAQSYTIALLREGRSRPRTLKVDGSVKALLRTLRLETGGRPFAICYEAGVNYGYLYDQLTKLARRVVVAHPKKLRAIWSNKRKHDRIDAVLLAQMLALDMVPTVHVPDLDVRSWRRLIVQRKGMVQDRATVKRRLRALARGCGVAAPKKPWSAAGRAAWSELEWPTEMDAINCENLLLELDALDERIRYVTRHLDRVARQSPAVQLLRTIPGVGPRTAEMLAAWIDQPQRFRSVRQIGTYLGLVPSQDQSGSTNRLGRITREGPAFSRGLLIEAAWTAVRVAPEFKAIFDRISHGKKDRRKKAIVAVARKIAVIALAMLRSGEVYTVRAA